MKKKQYSKQFIQEALAYWRTQLEKNNANSKPKTVSKHTSTKLSVVSKPQYTLAFVNEALKYWNGMLIKDNMLREANEYQTLIKNISDFIDGYLTTNCANKHMYSSINEIVSEFCEQHNIMPPDQFSTDDDTSNGTNDGNATNNNTDNKDITDVDQDDLIYSTPSWRYDGPTTSDADEYFGFNVSVGSRMSKDHDPDDNWELRDTNNNLDTTDIMNTRSSYFNRSKFDGPTTTEILDGTSYDSDKYDSIYANIQRELYKRNMTDLYNEQNKNNKNKAPMPPNSIIVPVPDYSDEILILGQNAMCIRMH